MNRHPTEAQMAAFYKAYDDSLECQPGEHHKAMYEGLSAALAVEAGAEPNPMSFFSENVDRWGAAEWFNRLANAIREQDKACVAKDDIAFETYRMIAASSAITLVRDHEAAVRSALTPASTAVEGEAVAPTVKASFVRGLNPGEVFIGHPDIPPHVWDGSKMVRLGPEGSEPAPAGEWRPIETAPHGVDVLLATPPFEYMGEQAKWELRVGAASWGERIGGISNISRDAHATHWRPLPAYPAPQTEDLA